jgi:hypothetical protein
MRIALLALFLLVASVARGENVIVVPPRSVVIQTAQDAAIVLARRGALVHTGCGQTEGIGFSPVSADDAIHRCCYWGKRKPRDIGVARGARGWYAVVRYY